MNALSSLLRGKHGKHAVRTGQYPASARSTPLSSLHLAAIWLAIMFLLGGSARADVPLLVVLRPLSVGAIALALWRIDAVGWRRVRAPALLLIAFAVLCLVHLMPLPPAVADALPGRTLVSDIMRQTGLDGRWRPLTVSPPGTWNALFSTLPPLALVLLLALERQRLWITLLVVLGLGLASMALGLLQLAAPPGSPLFFYEFYNYGSPIGFFANRNHQALFLACLLPALAAFVLRHDTDARARIYQVGATVFAMAIMIMLLTLGSRAGLLVGAIGFVAGCALLAFWGRPKAGEWRSGQNRPRWLLPAAALGSLIAFAGAALWRARRLAQAQAEALGPQASGEMRLEFWQPVMRMTREHFPFGSGIGSFVEAYRAGEPSELLDGSYLNHAHNDWLELAMTGGLPLVMLTVLVIAFILGEARGIASGRDRSEDGLCAAVALVWAVQMSIASFFDYPLRTPAMAGLAMLGLVWLSNFRQQRLAR